jgi:hypothetical protein
VVLSWLVVVVLFSCLVCLASLLVLSCLILSCMLRQPQPPILVERTHRRKKSVYSPLVTACNRIGLYFLVFSIFFLSCLVFYCLVLSFLFLSCLVISCNFLYFFVLSCLASLQIFGLSLLVVFSCHDVLWSCLGLSLLSCFHVLSGWPLYLAYLV